MHCTHIAAAMPLYMSRDLEQTDIEAIREHLLSCEPCRSLESQYLESDSWFKGLSDVEPDIAATFEVRDRVNRRLDKMALNKMNWGALVVAGAAAAVLLITSAFALTAYTRVDRSIRGPLPFPDNKSVAIVREEPPSLSMSTSTQKSSRKRVPGRLTSSARIERREATPPCVLSAGIDPDDAAATLDTRVPTRIEIQTADPSIRIIWLVSDHGGIE